MTRHIALFSGGHDSLAATHYAMEQGNANEVLHIDTGIGVPETREFVRETCDAYGWELSVMSNEDIPNKADTYDEWVRKNGFPGAEAHLYMYTNLKERVLDYVATETDGKPRLYTGVRRRESRNRMGRVKHRSDDGRRIWIAPLHDWSDDAVNRYINKHDLPTNPVVKNLHMSGECLCGAYATRDEELTLLEAEYPETAERIKELEDEVQSEHGTDEPKCWWGHANWSEIQKRAATTDENQMRLCSDCSLDMSD
jgi:3'-phosphoadenosine 5'-phosphosulfate sulfotransferase (PAPS reductase)/FAD synthetase